MIEETQSAWVKKRSLIVFMITISIILLTIIVFTIVSNISLGLDLKQQPTNTLTVQQQIKIIQDDPKIQSTIIYEDGNYKIITKEPIKVIDGSKETVLKDSTSFFNTKTIVTSDHLNKMIHVGTSSDIYQLVSIVIYKHGSKNITATVFESGQVVNGTSWVDNQTLKFGMNTTLDGIRNYTYQFEWHGFTNDLNLITTNVIGESGLNNIQIDLNDLVDNDMETELEVLSIVQWQQNDITYFNVTFESNNIIDPTIVVSSERYKDVDMAILDDSLGMFVMATCDNADDSAWYQVFYTNGTNHTTKQTIDAGVGAFCRIAISAFNDTAFVITYADAVEESTDWEIVGYDIHGTNIIPQMEIDNDIETNVDVAVAAYNSREYISAVVDDKENDVTYVVYDLDTQIKAQTDLDNEVAPDRRNSQMLDIYAISSTDAVVAFYDDDDDDLTYAIIDNTGSETKAPTDFETDAGASGSVAIADLYDGGFAIAFCDSTNDDLSIMTFENDGTVVTAKTQVDSNVGTVCSTHGAMKLEITPLNTTDKRFTILYDDDNEDIIYMVTYNYSGTQIGSTYTVEAANNTRKAASIIGYNSVKDKRICKYGIDTYPVVIAFNNLTGQARWETRLNDGGNWSGYCDNTPPTSISDLNNISNGYNHIYWNWTHSSDPSYSKYILYLDGVNIANTTSNFYNTSGLIHSTSYTLNVTVIDDLGYTNNVGIATSASTAFQPHLTISTIYPTQNINASINQFFNVTFEVSCINANCGEINVSLVYNNTNITSKYFLEDDTEDEVWSDCPNTPTNAYDEDFDTIGGHMGGEVCKVLINYTIPQGLVNGSLNELRSSLNLGQGVEGYCYNYSSSNWTLYANVASLGRINYSMPYDCLTGSKLLLNFTLPDAFPAPTYMYEDKMWWNISTTTTGNYGLVSTTTGDTPFYTNATNPLTINLNKDQSQQVTFWINATGDLNSKWSFYGFANRTSELHIGSNRTTDWNVTISEGLLTAICTLDLNTPVTYPDQTQANCSCVSDGTATLYRNGINVDAQNGTFINLGADSYAYVCNVSQTLLYSSDSASDTQVVNPSSDSCDVSFNETSPINWGTYFKVLTNCTSNYDIYRNGTIVANNSQQDLAAGYWNFTVIRQDQSNYTSTYNSDFMTVDQLAGIVYLYLNSSRDNITSYQNGIINISSTLNTGEGNIQVYNNNSLIYNSTSPSENITTFPNIGIYNITAQYLGNENITTAYETWYVNITAAPFVPTITLIHPINNSPEIDMYAAFVYEINLSVNATNSYLVINNQINGSFNTNPLSNQEQYFVRYLREETYTWYVNVTYNGMVYQSNIQNFTVDVIPWEVNGTVILADNEALIIRRCQA